MADLLTTGVVAESVLAIAASGSTVVLTNRSATILSVTGAVNQTIQLPNATTCFIGQHLVVANNSTGTVSFTYNDTTAFTTVPAGTSLEIRLTNNATTNGTWTRTINTGSTSLQIAYNAGNTIATSSLDLTISGSEQVSLTNTKGLIITNSGSYALLTSYSGTGSAVLLTSSVSTSPVLVLSPSQATATHLAFSGSTSGTLFFAAPSVVTNYTITYPGAVGTTGQVLTASDNAGTLAWTTPSTGNTAGSDLYLWNTYL